MNNLAYSGKAGSRPGRCPAGLRTGLTASPSSCSYPSPGHCQEGQVQGCHGEFSPSKLALVTPSRLEMSQLPRQDQPLLSRGLT